jgi:hypothetical protein
MASRTVINALTGLYFVIAIAEVMLELFKYIPGIMILKPLIPASLIALYWASSERRDPLYITAMVFSIITNVLFIPRDDSTLFIALITFFFHRVIILTYTIKMLRIKDYIPVVIGATPFILLFFYLQGISVVPPKLIVVMAVQNILISILAGIAIANFIIQDRRKNAWLLISCVLFIGLQAVVFIERFYLGSEIPAMRPLAMGVNAFAFYTFYEFAISAERSYRDEASVR